MAEDRIRRRMTLNGRVRPDGVEVLVEFAKTGPRQAEVETVDVRDEEPEGLSGFEIR